MTAGYWPISPSQALPFIAVDSNRSRTSREGSLTFRRTSWDVLPADDGFLVRSVGEQLTADEKQMLLARLEHVYEEHPTNPGHAALVLAETITALSQRLEAQGVHTVGQEIIVNCLPANPQLPADGPVPSKPPSRIPYPMMERGWKPQEGEAVKYQLYMAPPQDDRSSSCLYREGHMRGERTAVMSTPLGVMGDGWQQIPPIEGTMISFGQRIFPHPWDTQ